MKILYDPEMDALLIVLRADRVTTDSIDLEEGITVDLDEGGHVIGLEILDATEHLGHEALAGVTVDCLSVSIADA